MARRLRPVAVFGALVLVALIFVVSRSGHSEGLRKWASGVAESNEEMALDLEEEDTAESRFCIGEECFKGTWKPRSKPFESIDQLRPYKGCATSTRLRGATTEKANAERLLNVMNWDWTPYQGETAEWNAEEFVIRLLRSPGGLISVGDATSKDHFDSLAIYLERSGIRLQRFSKPPSSSSSSSKFVHQFTLAPDGPATASLMMRSRVPPSRLKRPILTMIEDSLLVNDGDLKIISQRLGTGKAEKWTTELPRMQTWPVMVEEMASSTKEDKDLVPEDTILLLNTGAHWSRLELSLLKSRDNPSVEQNYLTEAYRQMLRVMSEQLKPMSRLSIVYRATAPGHPKCYTRTAPYKSARMAETMEKNVISRLLQGVSTEEEREQKRKQDWDLFSVHNDLWRRAIVRLEQERKQALARPYPYTKVYSKWYYLDIWHQALQRPDAHRDPLADCLSYCSPALFDQWTRHLHHALQLEMDSSSSKTTANGTTTA